MKKFFAIYLAVLIYAALAVSPARSCPKCNADFRKELLEKRANTLGGQELLEAIKNQDGENSVVIPKKFVPQDEPLSEGMNQITAENENQDSAPGFFEIIKIFFTAWIFRS